MALRRKLILLDGDGEAAQHKWNLFLELMRWSEGGSCRHDAILRYFGDEEEVLSGCGRCDVCTHPYEEEIDPNEVGTVVRKALCAVARLHGLFGLQAVAKLLHGTQDKKLVRAGFKETRSWGSSGARGTLDRSATTALRHGRMGRLSRWRSTTSRADRSGQRLSTNAVPLACCYHRATALQVHGLYRRVLKSARPTPLKNSKAETVTSLKNCVDIAWKSLEKKAPPYVVASDRTLRDIALLRPINSDELKMAHGIGPSKAERYGDGFLQVVRQAV